MTTGIYVLLGGAVGWLIFFAWRGLLRALYGHLFVFHNAHRLGVMSDGEFLRSVPNGFLYQAKMLRWLHFLSWTAMLLGGCYAIYERTFKQQPEIALAQNAAERPQLFDSYLITQTIKHLVPIQPRIERTDTVITGTEAWQWVHLRLSGSRSVSALLAALGRPTSASKEVEQSPYPTIIPTHDEIWTYVAKNKTTLRIYTSKAIVVAARLELPVGGDSLAALERLKSEPNMSDPSGAAVLEARPNSPSKLQGNQAAAAPKNPSAPMPQREDNAKSDPSARPGTNSSVISASTATKGVSDSPPERIELESSDGRKKQFILLAVGSADVTVRDTGGQEFKIPFEKLSPSSVQLVKKSRTAGRQQ